MGGPEFWSVETLVGLGVRFGAGGEEGMSELIYQEGENNKLGKDDRKLQSTGTEGSVSVDSWFNMVQREENKHFRYYSAHKAPITLE